MAECEKKQQQQRQRVLYRYWPTEVEGELVKDNE